MNKIIRRSIFNFFGNKPQKISKIKTDVQWSVISKLGDVSERLHVPSNIEKPPYWESGHPGMPPLRPEIKTSEQLKNIKHSCSLAYSILDHLESFIKVGMTTDEIDKEVHRLCIENLAYPSPLNYAGFPKSCCTSVNNVACHGIPDSRCLENGDLLNVDITVFKNGMHGDCSRMYKIGQVDEAGIRLCEVTQEALDRAVKICKPEVPYYKIGEEIENFVQTKGFTVIPCFVGHGIGSYFHGPPDIYHHKYENSKLFGSMKPGVSFTIEPAVSEGTQEIVMLEDGWTACTLDNSRAAQYENTVFITNHGAEILTM